jgi:hypothetical protein
MKLGASICAADKRKAALRAGFSFCALATLAFSSVATAQTPQDLENKDKPVAATTTPLAPGANSLPDDLQPEKLTVRKPQAIDPNLVNKNRWDPTTLTQSTGLSAASFQQNTSSSATNQDDLGDSDGARRFAGDLLSAEDLLNVGDIVLPAVNSGLASPPREDGVINLNSSMRGALFNTLNDNINASVFKLDLGDRLCLGTADECQANEYETIELGYAKNITHGKSKGLNLQLTPRAGLRFDEDSKSALVGALVRIGDNLRDGSGSKSNTWYVFAGADAEAVSYSPTNVRRLTSGEFHLQDRIIVGDAQAGLGYRIGSADLALTYYKRQATAENYSYDEDAAALSVTWKR